MFLRTTSSALAVIALTAPAFAEVTPAQVWQNWVDYYKANGYTVTEGSREEAGETLTLKNVVMAASAPDNEGGVEFTMPEVTLTGTGDGKVRTVVAETSPLKLTFKNEEDEPVTLDGNVTLKDAEIVSSGAPEDMTHESRAAQLVFALNTITTPDGQKPMPISVTMVNATSSQRVVDGPVQTVDARMGADRADFTGTVEGMDKEDPTAKASFTGSIDALAGEGRFLMPKGVDVTKDLNAALKAGMDMSASFSIGAGKVEGQFSGKGEEDKDVSGQMATDVKGVELTVGMSTAGLKYQGSADASNVSLTSSDLPFPINYAVGGSTVDVQIPVMKSDAPVPFKVAYSLTGLTVGDELWNLFDPGKVLPREPASLDVDVTGLAKIAMDLFDPANVKAMEDAAEGTDAAAPDAAGPDATATEPSATDAPATDAPAADAPATDAPATDAATDTTTSADAGAADGAPEAADDAADTPEPFVLTELNVNKLALDAIGTKVDVTGALTVPEGGSIDSPVGTMHARLEGVNALIDNLVKLGILSQDEVSGYRMMLAMFAKPAPEGGDALVGEYEFKEGGQVFANGQQVK